MTSLDKTNITDTSIISINAPCSLPQSLFLSLSLSLSVSQSLSVSLSLISLSLQSRVVMLCFSNVRNQQRGFGMRRRWSCGPFLPAHHTHTHTHTHRTTWDPVCGFMLRFCEDSDSLIFQTVCKREGEKERVGGREGRREAKRDWEIAAQRKKKERKKEKFETDPDKQTEKQQREKLRIDFYTNDINV